MCLQSVKKIEPIDIPLDLAKGIIKEFAIKGGSSIKIVYRGEAMLYKYLIEVIEYAKERGIIEVILNTNGSLLNKKNSLELLNSGLDLLVFSVDSYKLEIYEKIRVRGKFSNVVKNVRRIYNLKKKLGKEKPLIRIQCINQELNKEEIKTKKFHEFWNKISDEIRISYHCVNLSNNRDIGLTPNFFCESVYQRMTVRADGVIALCCGNDLDNKILGSFPLDSLQSVWTGDKFKEIRKLMSEGKSHLIPPCNVCDGRRIHKEGIKSWKK